MDVPPVNERPATRAQSTPGKIIREGSRLFLLACQVIRQNGFGGFTRLLLAHLRGGALHSAALEPDLECLEFDRLHGTETATPVSPVRMIAPGRNYLAAEGYMPTRPSLIREMIAKLPIRYEDFTFVDIGCGKGLVLMIASEHPFQRAIGIEWAKDIYEHAVHNITAYRQVAAPKSPIEVSWMDAADYTFASGNIVIFMFNPFGPSVIHRVLDNLSRQPREIWLIYYNPVRSTVLDAAGFLERFYTSEGYVIYRSSTGKPGTGRKAGD